MPIMPTRAIPAGLAYPVPLSEPFQVATADGAITIPSGQVLITKGSAAALTLAAPAQDGLRLKITATTAHAHTVDLATSGVDGGGSDVGTFGGAAYDHVELFSYNSHWYVASKLNVSFA
jgi:hypothetical protein